MKYRFPNEIQIFSQERFEIIDHIFKDFFRVFHVFSVRLLFFSFFPSFSSFSNFFHLFPLFLILSTLWILSDFDIDYVDYNLPLDGLKITLVRVKF